MRTTRRNPVLFLLAVGVLGLLPAAARADIPPPDSCSTVGQACDNAADGGRANLSGTCQHSQCTRATPSGPVTYACNRCIPGATPSNVSGGASCSVARPGDARGAAGAPVTLAALALAALCASRRARG